MWYIKVAPRKPSNEGDWVSDNAKTASVTVDGRVIKIRNVRGKKMLQGLLFISRNVLI